MKYSSPINPLRKYGIDEKDVIAFRDGKNKEVPFKTRPNDYVDIQQKGVAVSCWCEINEKRALHVFIETKELLSFLEDQSPIDTIYDDGNSLFNMIKSKVKKENYFEANIDIFVMEVHYDDLSRSSSVFYFRSIPYDDLPGPVIDCYCMDDTVNDFLNITMDSGKPGFLVRSEDHMKRVRFIYNLALYIELFPSSIVDGTPEEIKSFEKYYSAKNRIKLTPHESLIDRSTITPHFRRGHWARLSAERYKKMKGKTIFVRSTFVKGHAKTVLDSEEARKEMKP